MLDIQFQSRAGVSRLSLADLERSRGETGRGSGFLRFLGELFGKAMGVDGVFVGLTAELVSGQVLPFAMGGSGGFVGVGGEVVEFRDSIMYALWHCFLLAPLF